MSDSAYVYCPGCNVQFVPGCGEEEYHARCPHRCSLCQRLIRFGGDAEYGWCPGHSITEAVQRQRSPRGKQ